MVADASTSVQRVLRECEELYPGLTGSSIRKRFSGQPSIRHCAGRRRGLILRRSARGSGRSSLGRRTERGTDRLALGFGDSLARRHGRPRPENREACGTRQPRSSYVASFCTCSPEGSYASVTSDSSPIAFALPAWYYPGNCYPAVLLSLPKLEPTRLRPRLLPSGIDHVAARS